MNEASADTPVANDTAVLDEVMVDIDTGIVFWSSVASSDRCPPRCQRQCMWSPRVMRSSIGIL